MKLAALILVAQIAIPLSLSPMTATAQDRANDVEEYLRVSAFDAEKVRSRAMVRLGDYLLAVEDAEAGPVSDPTVHQLLMRRDLRPVVYERLRTGWKQWVVDCPSLFRPWRELMDASPEEFESTAKRIATNVDGLLNESIAAALKSDKPTNPRELAWLYNGQIYAIERQWGERFRGELARQLTPTEKELSAGLVALRAVAVGRVNAAYRASITLNPKFDKSTMELVKWLTEPGSPFVLTAGDFETGQLFPKSIESGFREDIEARLTAGSNSKRQ